jgi:hypothetical protein
MLLCNCKEKIKNFSTAFAIALMSARLEQTVCCTKPIGSFKPLIKSEAFALQD